MVFYNNSNYSSNLNRVDFAKFLRPNSGMFSSHDSFFFNKIASLKKIGEYNVRSEGGRIDVISYKIYGSYSYWWVLLLYNGYKGFEEVKIGDVISFPSLDDIEKLYYLAVS